MKLLQKLILLLMIAISVYGCSRSKSGSVQEEVAVHTYVKDFANVHLLVTPYGNLLIETGLSGNTEEILQWLREKGVAPENLKAVIVTHAHYDHAGGAKYLQQKFGVPIVAGAPDSSQLLLGENGKLCPTGFVASWMAKSSEGTKYPSVQVDVAVEKSLSLAEITAEPELPGMVYLLPGHTPGSIVVVINEMAFVGDLFRGSMIFKSAERHLFMCDLKDNDQDIRYLLEDIGKEVQTFFPSHFGPVTREALENM
jgi:glyoxylase-like metal-dependent hydrolase (beta-lactamase superfamily II)